MKKYNIEVTRFSEENRIEITVEVTVKAENLVAALQKAETELQI
jgi:DNA-binding MarR family transcriptional regulator